VSERAGRTSTSARLARLASGGGLEFRLAGPQEAQAVARLHADSWRRHYRGAYADAFLDGDVLADRLAEWTARLGAPDAGSCTIVALAPELVGFAHTVFDDDPTWGALLDNMHVAAERQRHGIGSALLTMSAAKVAERSQRRGLYLWVLEQNTAAQAFYTAHGAAPAGREPVTAPGGKPGRLVGAPAKLRYAWPRAGVLARR
jgi:ribosomal protein S18 acetylase RimI-like enzyme